MLDYISIVNAYADWSFWGWSIIAANIALPVIILFIAFIRFLLAPPRQDDKPIVPEHRPPQGLRPIEIGTFIDFRLHPHDISGEILLLALEGYLQISRDSHGFKMTVVRDPGPEIPLVTRALMHSMAEKEESCYLQDFQIKGHINHQYLNKKLFQSFYDRHYFYHDPFVELARYHWFLKLLILCAIGYVFLLFAIAYGYNLLWSPFWGLLGGFVALLVIMPGVFLAMWLLKYFNLRLLSLTEEGLTLRRHILGLKLFIETVELSRLEFENDINTPSSQKLLALLPYAVALNLETDWTKALQDCYVGKFDIQSALVDKVGIAEHIIIGVDLVRFIKSGW